MLERLQVERTSHRPSVSAVGLHHIQPHLAVLLDGECDIPSIGGDCRAANDSRSLTTPQLRGSSVGKLPDALARAGGGNVQKIIWPSRGENPVLVDSEIGAAAETWVGALVIGKRQRVLFGLASVTTTRRPSALAASDVYRSSPELKRWGMRRSMSML